MEMYLSLLKQGWTLNQIDEMDILFYFELMRHTAKKHEEENTALLDSMGF
jgi:hypothetical protein